MSQKTKNETVNASSQTKQRAILIIIAVIAVVGVGVGVAIAMSGSSGGAAVDYAEIETSRLEDGGFVIGNPDAPVTLVEFADFACPHCQAYRPTINRFMEEYVATGQAKFEFRIFPTTGGELTRFAGQIAECADMIEPGKYWEAHDVFFDFAESGRYGQDMGRDVANALGLDYSEILTCTNGADQVTSDMALARGAGVSGTPATMVRYGDGPVQWITVDGQEFSRGGVTFEVIERMMEQVQ